MKIRIVQSESENREVDLLRINEDTVTLCGVPWTHVTRREWFVGDAGTRRHEVECYKCKEEATKRVIASLRATSLLARWAALNWDVMKRHAGII